MTKEKEIKLTKQEMVNICKLLYAGNFGLSANQFDSTVRPIINKLTQMVNILANKL